MDASELTIIFRGIERLGIVLVSAIGIYMGAKLFMKGVVTEQSANLKGGGWSIHLQKVGPGVFFALFGSAILIYAISSPVFIPEGENGKDEAGRGISYLGSQVDISTYRDIAEATNLVQEVKNNQFDNQDLQMANALLIGARKDLIIMLFGIDVYRECPIGGESDKFKEECEEISSWYASQ